MVVVVAASTVFAFMLGWELMTLLSAGLILIEGDGEDRRRSLFIYLAIHLSSHDACRRGRSFGIVSDIRSPSPDIDL